MWSKVMRNITKHYIDGAFVDPHGREVLQTFNPVNSRVSGPVLLADDVDARRAIAAVKHALPAFSRTTKEERVKLLRRMHEATAARLDDLKSAMVEEYGGTLQFSKLIVEEAVEAFRQAEIALNQIELVRKWGTTTAFYQPVGVAGLITPWNANVLFLCVKTASAIAAGCTVVAKPSELSAWQTQVLLECLHEAGLPQGVLNVVSGRGEVVGAEFVRNPDVDKISFTGSAAVGQSVMRDGAATMKRITLELGGKSRTSYSTTPISKRRFRMRLSSPFSIVVKHAQPGRASWCRTTNLIQSKARSSMQCGNFLLACLPIRKRRSGLW
jgi:aldehyde dehydrogenase (NAD+)